MTDVIDAVLDLREGDQVWTLRRSRPEVLENLQAGYDAIYDPSSPTISRLSLEERAAIALRVCTEARVDSLADHYLRRIEDLEVARSAAVGQSPDHRLNTILEYATLVAASPADSGVAEIERMRAEGLDDTAIVTVSQVIAFTAFQLRVVAGLYMIGY